MIGLSWSGTIIQCNFYKDMHLCTGVRVILTLVSCLLHKWKVHSVQGSFLGPQNWCQGKSTRHTVMRISLTLLFWLSLAMFALDPAILADLPQLYIYIYPHVPRSKHGGWSGWSTIWIPNILAISTQITLMGVGQHPSKAACWHKSSDLLG